MAEPVPFPSKLFSLLSILEKIAIVVALLGVAFNYLRFTGANMLLMIGLSTLAGVYFLTGFRPPEKADDEQKLGFAALLATTILPKVSWIACAVLVIGIQFHLLHLPGATQQLQIGALAGAAAAVIFGFLVSRGNEHAKLQIGVLYRLVPMLIITSYFLMPPSA